MVTFKQLLFLLSLLFTFSNSITIVQKSIDNIYLLILFSLANLQRFCQDLWSWIVNNSLLALLFEFLRRLICRKSVFQLLPSLSSHHLHAMWVQLRLEQLLLVQFLSDLLSLLFLSLLIYLITSQQPVFNRLILRVCRPLCLVQLLLLSFLTGRSIPQSMLHELLDAPKTLVNNGIIDTFWG